MEHNGTATKTATEQKLYRIGEVSRLTELKPFVLRYWESEFPILEPVKSPNGHRMYRQEDLRFVFKIKPPLYAQGFSIAAPPRPLPANRAASSETISSGAHNSNAA